MPLMDTELAAVKANFDVNVFGNLAMTQAFLPMLLKSKGIVANQCSIAGLQAGRQPFIGVYSATKAAAICLSDTVRVELKPFGIRVVTLVTGDVKTQFWNNADGAHRGLPENSLYDPIEEQAEKMMRGETNPPGQHTRERWAREVVRDLLSSHCSAHVRRGHLATLIGIVSWLAPIWLLDYAFSQVSGLTGLSKILRQESGALRAEETWQHR